MGGIIEIAGATIAGFIVQGGVYKLLLKRGVSETWALFLAALIFAATYIVVGAYGMADGGCPSSKHLGLLSLFSNGGSGSSWFDVKPLGVDGSSGGFGWSVS